MTDGGGDGRWTEVVVVWWWCAVCWWCGGEVVVVEERECSTAVQPAEAKEASASEGACMLERPAVVCGGW